jgi:prepilin-type N-terminal cleavage/methylation domain-containing protein
MSKRWGVIAARGDGGFSLIEVTVVVALVGLLAAVGLPTMQDWLDRYKVRTAAEELASLIQLQRMRAVSQNTEFSIDFDASGGAYTLYEGDAATGTAIEQVAHTLPTGVAFAGNADPVNVPSDEMIFHPDGSLNNSTATTDTIYMSNTNGDVFLLSINRSTGRVQVQHQSYGY